MPARALTDHAIRSAMLKACRLDVVAFKPGNVSILSPGHRMTAADFLKSAAVAMPAVCDNEIPVGERMARAITSTQESVGCNTNLGIVLLLAPMAAAATQMNRQTGLHAALANVLAGLSVDDTHACFRAIRAAGPAGLGTAAEQDVNEEPAQPLQQAMALAADRDRIAAAYSSVYAEVFEFGLPRLQSFLDKWRSLSWAATLCYLELLTVAPDSHVGRKFGLELARAVSDEVAPVTIALKACENPREFMGRLSALDKSLKQRGINPGTCADLTVATIAAFLLTHRAGLD